MNVVDAMSGSFRAAYGMIATVLVCSSGVHAQCERWHSFVSGGQIGTDNRVRAVTVWNGELIAGGDFISAGGQVVNRIARWDGTAWHPFVSDGEIGVSDSVRALIVWNGDLIAGGEFHTAGGKVVNRIARWDGSEWHPFTAEGQAGFIGGCCVNALAIWNGNLIAAGSIHTAGGQVVNNIVRWDGFAWHPFVWIDRHQNEHVGLGQVNALIAWNGSLIAGGLFGMAGGQSVNGIVRWDGSAWHPLVSDGQAGLGGSNPTCQALHVWKGDLIVGGSFASAGAQTMNNITRWDGSSWHPFTSGGQVGVSSGILSVLSLTVWEGDLVVGGWFDTAGGVTVNRIARWDGSAWHPFTTEKSDGLNGGVDSLTVWYGDLVAGGLFLSAGPTTLNNIAQWRTGSCSSETCALPLCGSHVECSVFGPEYDNRTFVARLLKDGCAECTAWVIAAPDLIMTNAHCIEPGNHVYSIEFNYECSFCGAGVCKLTSIHQVVQLIAHDAPLDFAILRVDGNVAAQWGQAVIDPAPVTTDMQMYKIHHASGDPKVISFGTVTDTNASGCNVSGVLEVSRVAGRRASGAPVFRMDNHAVAALHYCGDPGCIAGKSVPMSAVWPAAQPHILAAGGTPIVVEGQVGDLNGDGVVDVGDLLNLLAAWGGCGTPSPPCPADINGDGVVDVSDLLILLANWG